MKDATDAVKLVAFIFSPLQALNLVEYCERFDRQVDIAVVGGVSSLEPTSRTQIDAVLALAKPRKILYQEWSLRATRPIGARRAVVSAVSTLRAHLTAGPYEFVVGEYRSAFSWAVLHGLKVLPQRVVVVDDGTAMLRIDRRNSFLRSPKVRRQKLKALTFLAMGIQGAVSSSDLTFFTTYRIDAYLAAHDTIVHNDYRILTAELRSLPPDDDTVYVIGTPHLEAGVVDRGDVELALELIRFAAESTGKQAVYMAHRRERVEKLDALRKEFPVVVPSVPFEIYPRIIGKRPRKIVGYYSSLFVTASELLGDSVEIIALQMPRECINDSWFTFIDDVYRYYRSDLQASVRVVERPTPLPK
ncbi:hypothetical protein MCEMIE22_00695 [Mycobacteriaceae bacterium]